MGLSIVMKVQLIVSKDIEEPYAEIHTNALTENIQKVMALLENENLEEVMENKSILAVKKDKDIVFLDFEDIFMIRVEDKQTKVYGEKQGYIIKKPLYQIEETLDHNFVRLSKTTIVNLRKIKRVTPSLKGMMFIELNNGLKDNISRKYLADFKRALDF
jgi:DNA-binding LytR/AlgR family response regulator